MLSAINIFAQVVADFSANTTSGCPNPLLILLNDQSTSASGPIDSWSWTLSGPAGFTSITSNTNQLSTSLSIPGFYSVTLTACTNGLCDTKTESNYIEIFDYPSFTYNITPLDGCSPHQACFDGAITSGCGTVASILFDANDGVVYNTEDFCHTYSNAGTYTNFTVSIQNSCGCVITEIIQDTIEVVDKPTASFTASQTFSCNAPLNVNFTNTSTATASAEYSWNIPGLVTNNNATNISQTFGVGTFDVQLIVTENGVCADTITQANYISVGVNPVSDFSANFTQICPGEAVQFTDLSSGSPTGWAWQIIGGVSSSFQNPNIVFNTSGVFDVELTTTYPGGCQDSEIKIGYITVQTNPENNFTVTDSGSCLLPFSTTFNSTSTNTVATSWSFPGGTPATANGSGPINVTYNSYGNYNVIMYDTSSNGCLQQKTYSNVIMLNPLNAIIIGDTLSGCLPITSSLGALISGSDSITSYSWVLPGSDILNSNIDNPEPTYSSVGCNDVSLDITSLEGCTYSISVPNLICAGNPPIADFDFTPQSSCFEVEDICFSFTGSGADTILWNFDDGPMLLAGPGESPCHGYNTDIGNYSPSMVAFSNGCPSDTVRYIDSVNILGPISVFTADIKNCTEWNTFEFTNSSVQADSSYWVFGDPSVAAGMDTSTQENPSWTYPAYDTLTNYTITLYAYSDTSVCEHQSTQTIQVYENIADFTYSDSIGCAPLTITFTNTSNYMVNSAANTRWNWDSTYRFSSGAPNIVWNNGATRSKIYNAPGIYDVIMRNEDARACNDTILKSNIITVHGVATGFTSDIDEGCFPLSVNFIDTSIAPLSYITSWHWNFGTGNPADTSNLQNPSFTYNIPGDYSVTLSASDSFGCTNSIVYNNFIDVNGPTASFSLSDTFICNNQNVTINNLSTGSNLNYNWQFQNADIPSYNANGNPPVLTFLAEGNNTIYLEVIDDLNCSDDTTIVLPVFDAVAIGVASEDTSLCPNPPLFVQFTNNSMNSIDSNSIVWDFGNGTSSNDYNPAILYGVPGEYIVTLTVNSFTNCPDTVVVDTIVIDGPWGEFELLDSPKICNCDSVSFAINTINAISPVFLVGDGQAIPFFPAGTLGDTLRDTLKIEYCELGYYAPGIAFSEGACSYILDANPRDTVRVDTIVANFTFSDQVICDTGTICFLDSSYNEIAGFNDVNSWNWDFGDGSTSNLQNPCHFYSMPGVYQVCLEAGNQNGCVNTHCDSVFIRIKPQANFGISDTAVCLNNTLLFYDSSVVSNDANIARWHWNFGTGNFADTSNLAFPNFKYTSPGLYTVCLTVTSNLNCVENTDDTCKQVLIYALPQASEIIDTVCLGVSNNFDDNSINGDGNIITNYWNFGQNVADTSLLFSNNGDVSFQYNSFGVYNVTHIVADNLGCTDTSFNQATVYDNPTASFTYSSLCLIQNNEFTSTSLAGLDAVNAINNYDWNFDEGAFFINGLATQNYIFMNTGNHNVSLAISDSFGCVDTVSQVVNILSSPVANFTISSNEICEGEQINLDASSTTFATVGAQYYWDENYNTGVDNNLVNYSISPNSDAQIMFVIQDDNNCTDTTFQSFEVHQNPSASFTYGSACVNLPIPLNSTSVEGDTTLNNFNWLINGISSSFGLNSSFITPNTNAVTVQLVVEDINTCTDSSLVVNINADTTVFASIDLNDTVICAPADISLQVNGTAASYLWTPQFIFDNSTSDIVTASVSSSITIEVIASSVNNFCPQALDTFTVLVASEPQIEYSTDINPVFVGLSTGVDLEILPFNNATDSIYWEENSSLLIIDALSVEVSPTELTDYPFSVFYFFNGITCQLDSFVNIQILEECSEELILAPNVFTPNNDQKNDLFRISGVNIDYLNYLRIFDRWGKIVYEKENLDFTNGIMKREDAWDGNYASGKYVNNGVYVIMYEGVCLNGESVSGSGNVTLIR